MRLWHKYLIPVLPRQQLISQWRECCCIAKNIADKGTPNHMLVDKVLDYHIFEFTDYTQLVLNEMQKRGYKISKGAYIRFVENCNKGSKHFNNTYLDYVLDEKDMFCDWHTKRYLAQCYRNLQEKFDCHGIDFNDWEKINCQYLLMTQKTRFGVVKNKENRYGLNAQRIYCIPTGETKNGRKIWTEYDCKTKKLINQSQKYLLTTGKTYPSNNIFIPCKKEVI